MACAINGVNFQLKIGSRSPTNAFSDERGHPIGDPNPSGIPRRSMLFELAGTGG
jgi:hypothetical protein